MWKRSDSKRFIPTGIGRRFRASSFHDPEQDRAQRQPSRPTVHFDGYGQSLIGRTRRINQDQFFTMPLGADASGLNCFLGVADGIGGAHPLYRIPGARPARVGGQGAGDSPGGRRTFSGMV